MDKAIHLTEDHLMLFMDGELNEADALGAGTHLKRCPDCQKRLQVLKAGSAAYSHYRRQILDPALQVPLTRWAHPTPQPGLRLKFLWAAAAALAAGLVLVWLHSRSPSQPDAQQILANATAKATTEPAQRTLLWTSSAYKFLRPATLRTGSSDGQVQHVQSLFVKANYSWENPLSARSFSEWRRQLHDKKDSVTAIREANGQQFYRVRTSTDAGVLRAAAITLQTETYHATHASFEFQGEDLLEVSEQTAEVPVKIPSQTVAIPLHPKAEETQAGPEDELRVFAALDAIGSASDDPIEVKLDQGHHSVLVTGLGLPANRQKQIEAALTQLPNTIVRFSDNKPLPRNTEPPATPEAAEADSAQLFHQQLRDRAGGPRQLQEITDRALEASNELFAQAHSLQVLTQEFPPLVESALSPASANTLLALRQRHVGAMLYALRQLKDALRPLLAGDSGLDVPMGNLFEATGNLDRLVSRLLAGSYSQQAGEEMLKQLPGSITQVETLVRAQSTMKLGGG